MSGIAQVTDVANAFSTTLTAGISATDTTITVDSTGDLTAPCYLIIEPLSGTKREVVLCDSNVTATTFVLSGVSKRGLDAPAVSHLAGAKVISGPVAQHIDDLNARVDDVDRHLTVGATEPPTPQTGDLWVDTTAVGGTYTGDFDFTGDVDIQGTLGNVAAVSGDVPSHDGTSFKPKSLAELDLLTETAANGAYQRLHEVDVALHGATGSGDESTEFQAAIDAAAALAGAASADAWLNPIYVVGDPSIVYEAAGLVLPSRVVLKNLNLKVPNGANTDCVISEDFATLTGTDTVKAANGVPYAFGLLNVRINGNKANQSAGRGIKFYGGRVIMQNVMVDSCFSDGIYCEGPADGGQNGIQDTPEGMFGPVWSARNGGHGVHFRGMHDTRMGTIIVNDNGGDGIFFDDDTAYNGGCDVDFIHSYSNQGAGARIEARCGITFLQVESNYSEGVVVDDETLVRIGHLYAFKNWRDAASAPSTKFSVDLQGGVTVGIMQVREFYGQTAVRIGDVDVEIGMLHIDGNSTNGRGLLVGASRAVVGGGAIRNFDGGSGVGLDFAATVTDSAIGPLSITECDTCVDASTLTTSERNLIHVYGHAPSPFVGLVGTFPTSADNDLLLTFTGAGGGSDGWTIQSRTLTVGGQITGTILSASSYFLTAGGSRIYSGSGSPEGSQSAPLGSILLDTGGGAGTALYIKESGGTGNTGWRSVGVRTGSNTELNNAANVINTADKFAGKEVFNTSSNRPVWATGSGTTSTWVYADGTTAHTPA